MPANVLLLLLYGAGLFSVVLGTLHFFLPALLDYRALVLERPAEWKAPRPFRVWLTRYVVSVRDRYAIIWVMNHVASYVLITIGLTDLFAAGWLQRSEVGRLVALWMAGWWFVRAATQLYFGRRVGDWAILAWFALLGLLHLAVWYL